MNTVAGSTVPAVVSGQRQTTSTARANVTTPTTTPGSGAQITSKDFLTLLVTELKNQDPTRPTDPNAYIQQLVGVNSLQQLISINQELAGTTVSTQGNLSAKT